MSLFNAHRVSSMFAGSLVRCSSLPSSVAAQNAFPPECCIGGIALGPQTYTFHRFTFFEAIDKAKELGCSVIEGSTCQKLSPDQPDVTFNHQAPPTVWAKTRIKLERTGVRMVAYGVVEPNNNEETNRKMFDFAKLMGVSIITTEPEEVEQGSFDLIEKLANEYNIKIAVHNHPKQPDKPDYKYWDPNYVLECVKGRDPRIGACADTGHWARSGVNPIDALKILEGRILICHLKDLNKFGVHDGTEHDVPWGTGVCDMKGILDELHRQHFSGMVSMEYEHNWMNSMPDLMKCVAFVREHGKDVCQ
ncbi:MAG: sugar phosphate isomerase/epimerase [bacterium]